MTSVSRALQRTDDGVLVEVVSQIIHRQLEGFVHCTIDADVMSGPIEFRVNAMITVVGLPDWGEERGCKMLELGLTIERVFG